MLIAIVPFYAGILALIYVVLTLRTIRGRKKYKINVGLNDEIAFTRLVRAHGNFSEYAPFIIFLLALIEMQKEWNWFIHLFGCLLILSRILHAIAVSNVKEVFALRKIAMVSTIVLLLVTGSINIYLYVQRFMLPL